MTAFVLLLNKRTIGIYMQSWQFRVLTMTKTQSVMESLSGFVLFLMEGFTVCGMLLQAFSNRTAADYNTADLQLFYRFLKLPVLCCQSGHAYLPISVCKLCAEQPS